MGKEIATHAQEALRVSYRISTNRNIPKQILIKLAKIKQKEKLESAREKQQTTYKRIPIRLHLTFQQKPCRPEDILK